MDLCIDDQHVVSFIRQTFQQAGILTGDAEAGRRR
jgi:hypothetical protein